MASGARVPIVERPKIRSAARNPQYIGSDNGPEPQAGVAAHNGTPVGCHAAAAVGAGAATVEREGAGAKKK